METLTSQPSLAAQAARCQGQWLPGPLSSSEDPAVVPALKAIPERLMRPLSGDEARQEVLTLGLPLPRPKPAAGENDRGQLNRLVVGRGERIRCPG